MIRACFIPPSTSPVKSAGGAVTCWRASDDITGSYFAQGIHWGLSSFVNPLLNVPQRVGSVRLMQEGLHEPTLAGVQSIQVSIFPRPIPPLMCAPLKIVIPFSGVEMHPRIAKNQAC